MQEPQGGDGLRRAYSVGSVFGGRDHYDENGKLIGYSVDSVISGEDFYDVDGQFRGYSMDSVMGNGQNCYY